MVSGDFNAISDVSEKLGSRRFGRWLCPEPSQRHISYLLEKRLNLRLSWRSTTSFLIDGVNRRPAKLKRARRRGKKLSLQSGVGNVLATEAKWFTAERTGTEGVQTDNEVKVVLGCEKREVRRVYRVQSIPKVQDRFPINKRLERPRPIEISTTLSPGESF